MEMEKIWRQAYNGLQRTKKMLLFFCLGSYLLTVLLSGGTLMGAFRFWLCVLGYLYLPGLLLVRVAGLDRDLPHARSPLAILFGTGFLCVLYCFCMRLGLLWALRLLPPLLAICWLLLCWNPVETQAGLKKVWRSGPALFYGLLVAGLIALFAFSVVVKNARPSAVGAILPNQDLLWNIGNANSFKLAFPPQDIRFSQVRLTYHYLTEMVEGILSLVSGLPAYDVVAFYMGPAVLLALVCCLFALGNLFYRGNRDKTAAFVFGLFLFNCASMFAALLDGRGLFWNYNLSYLVTNLNAQGTALIFASLFFLLFTGMARKDFRVSWRCLAAFLGSFVLLCFAKGPVAAVTACSFAITMVFVLFRRPHYGKALVSLAGVLGIFVTVYTTFYASGVNTSMRLGDRTFQMSAFSHYFNAVMLHNRYLWYLSIPLFALLILFCMQPLQLPLYLRGLWDDVRGLFHLPAERLLINGAACGGAVAYFLFLHPSSSQLYFVLFAIFCINLLAADRVGRPAANPFKAMMVLLGGVGLLTTLVLCVNFVGSGGRQLLRNLDIIPKYPYPAVVCAEDEAAMEWLSENAAPNDLFATNRIDAQPGTGEGVSWIYTALSGRQAYMEGYTYAVTNMGVAEAAVAEKKAVNAAFFSANTSPSEIVRLARENGVRYLVVSLQFPGDTIQLVQFPLVYENSKVQIYRVENTPGEE